MSPDVHVARLAAQQRGVVTRGQLAAAGLTASAIRHRLRAGRLHPYVAGTYLVGHAAPLPRAAETAAVLSCGPDAVLSHGSAAALWGIEEPESVVHVTLPRHGPSRRADVRIHRVRRLDPADLRRRGGFRLTAPARTLLDLAALVSAERLDGALERARAAGLVRPDEVMAAIRRTPKRRGATALRRLLEERPTLTRSRAERLLGDLVRRGGLPQPQTNAVVEGFEVDLVWAAQRLVVEFDGFAFHADRRAFERDRRRDAELQAAGYRVFRVTWRRLQREPEAVLVTIARLLVAAREPGFGQRAVGTAPGTGARAPDPGFGSPADGTEPRTARPQSISLRCIA